MLLTGENWVIVSGALAGWLATGMGTGTGVGAGTALPQRRGGEGESGDYSWHQKKACGC